MSPGWVGFCVGLVIGIFVGILVMWLLNKVADYVIINVPSWRHPK